MNNTKEIDSSPRYISIKGLALDVSAFDKWKKQLESNNVSDTPVTHHENIIKELASFDVLNKTPLDCQYFLINIQKILNGILC